MECVVCLESLAQGIAVCIPCGHAFHLECAATLRRLPGICHTQFKTSCLTCARMYKLFALPIEGLRRIFFGDGCTLEQSQKALQKCQRERDAARAEVTRLGQSLAAQQERIDDLSRRCLDSDVELSRRCREIQDVRRKSRNVRIAYNQLDQANHIAQLQLQALRTQHAQDPGLNYLSEDLAMAQQALEAEREQHDADKEALRRMTHEYDTLSRKIDEEKDKNDSLRARVYASEEAARLKEEELRAQNVQLQEREVLLRTQGQQLLDLHNSRERSVTMRASAERMPTRASTDHNEGSEVSVVSVIDAPQNLDDNHATQDASQATRSSDTTTASAASAALPAESENEEAEGDATNSTAAPRTDAAPVVAQPERLQALVITLSPLGPVASNVQACRRGGGHKWSRKGTNAAVRRYQCKACAEIHKEKAENGFWIEV